MWPAHPSTIRDRLSVYTINPVNFSENIPWLGLLVTFIDISHAAVRVSLTCHSVLSSLFVNSGDCFRFVVPNFNSLSEDFGFWQVDSLRFILWSVEMA